MKPKADVSITTMLSTFDYSIVTVQVTIEGETLTKMLSGPFLNWRIKRTVKKFKETLEACVAYEL